MRAKGNDFQIDNIGYMLNGGVNCVSERETSGSFVG